MPDTHGVAGTSGLGQSVAAAVSRTGHLQILFLMFLVRNIFYDCCCCCPPMCGTTSILPLPHPFYPSLTSLSSLSLSLYLSIYLSISALSLSLFLTYSFYFLTLSLSIVSILYTFLHLFLCLLYHSLILKLSSLYFLSVKIDLIIVP